MVKSSVRHLVGVAWRGGDLVRLTKIYDAANRNVKKAEATNGCGNSGIPPPPVVTVVVDVVAEVGPVMVVVTGDGVLVMADMDVTVDAAVEIVVLVAMVVNVAVVLPHAVVDDVCGPVVIPLTVFPVAPGPSFSNTA